MIELFCEIVNDCRMMANTSSNQRLSVSIALIRSEIISTGNMKLTFNQILQAKIKNRSYLSRKQNFNELFRERVKMLQRNIPAGIYLLKVNNRNTRPRCKICSKLTIKTPKRRNFDNFEHILHCLLVFLLFTLDR